MATLQISIDLWLNELSQKRNVSVSNKESIKTLFNNQIQNNSVDGYNAFEEACFNDYINWNIFFRIITKSLEQDGRKTANGYVFMLVETDKGILAVTLDLTDFLEFTRNSNSIGVQEIIDKSVTKTYYLSYEGKLL